MQPHQAPPPQHCYRHPDHPAGIICQRCDRPICPNCMHQASVGFHCPDCARKGAQKVVRGPGGFVQQPKLTIGLIAANVLVFLIGLAVQGGDALSGGIGRMAVDYGLVARLWQMGDSTSLIYVGPVPGTHEIGVGSGEVYRLVTSGFLHHGLLHLAVNMYALWVLGRVVEAMAGRLRFALIYGVSLLAGSLGALLLDPDAFTAGASGAIFGLMGALLLAQRAQGIALRDSPLLGVLLLNVVITFGISNISIGGHLGGLAGGAVTGWLLFDLARRPGIDRRMPLAVCAGVGLACVAIAYAISTGHMPSN